MGQSGVETVEGNVAILTTVLMQIIFHLLLIHIHTLYMYTHNIIKQVKHEKKAKSVITDIGYKILF